MKGALPGRFLETLLGPSEDKRQRLRLRRFFMSIFSYVMWSMIALAAWDAGLLIVSGTGMALAGAGVFLSQLLFYLLIRSGLNLKFDDPSLTLPQIVVGLAWSLVLVAVSREIRGLTMVVYMVTLLFGIFALDRKQFVIAALLGFSGYAGLVLFERINDPGIFSESYYVMSVTVLGAVLVWTMLFGVYVSNLRYKLQLRNEELEKANLRIREIAEHDDLTGIYNRRYIMDALARLKARSDRTGETFSLVLIDLDHFKKINDKYGHAAGDQVLADFAELTRETLRGMDLVAHHGDHSFGRYGGEEFVILLPVTSLEGARQCAERLRQRQEEVEREENSRSFHVTLSAGIAEYRRPESVEDMLRRADQALYAAKKNGRNCVVEEPA